MQPGDQLAVIAQQLGLIRLDRATVARADARRAIRCGDLRRVRRGIYCRDRRQRPSLVERVVAALMLLPPNSLACGLTAARLWRIDGLPQPTSDEPLHFLVRGRGAALSGCRLHARAWAAPVEFPCGVPATSVATTVVWLSSEWGFADGLVVVEGALRADPHRASALRTEIDARPPRYGAAAARRVIEVASDRSESPLESRARALWIEHDVPVPMQQAEIRAGGRFLARVDFLWPEAMLVVEVDGFAKYETSGELQRDRARHNRLDAEGYTVRRFTWADVVHRPASVVAQVRAALWLG